MSYYSDEAAISDVLDYVQAPNVPFIPPPVNGVQAPVTPMTGKAPPAETPKRFPLPVQVHWQGCFLPDLSTLTQDAG